MQIYTPFWKCCVHTCQHAFPSYDPTEKLCMRAKLLYDLSHSKAHAALLVNLSAQEGQHLASEGTGEQVVPADLPSMSEHHGPRRCS